ncbi:MAG: HlyD family efflux transporter periplasmic adaptor subunit [Alphaproteobacteria bacterium]|nr:HlyD family efflux transporter periplasmic adaptor subunit [Alphaproteobacteria bacterium]
MRRARLHLAALAAVAVFVAGTPLPRTGHGSVIAAADAQSRLRTLIDRLRGNTLPAGVARTNGRIEATQIDVAAKYAGRLSEVSVEEGDPVTAGQVVARISAPEYEAQLRGAQAQVVRAEHTKAEAEAQIAARNSDLQLAQAELDRAEQLARTGSGTIQNRDQRRAAFTAAQAALRAVVAQRSQAEFAIRSAEADEHRLQAILDDLILRAPRNGRVQYKLAWGGEVIGAGSRVLTILDLADVYMTIFLPAAQAGRLKIGDEARIILDPVPQYVVPAKISFVAADAQFTPKTVETREEREKLVFRVRLQIDPDVLRQYENRVKTGVRGLGFVRTNPETAWPADLQVQLP